MYLPEHFAEGRLDVLTAFIREHPFATLVSPTADGLFATHLPMLWDPEPAPFGTLTGHFARPNPHGRAAGGGTEGSPRDTVAPGEDSLAIFLGPQAYVSPSWYPEKAEHGKVVPTWNYVTVHAQGPLTTIDDPTWLRAFVTRLTETQERAFARPWRITDAPEPFVAQMLNGIVGVEMPIRRLEGKWKLGQNRPAADYAGAIAGLEARGDAASAAVAAAMTAWRRDRSG